MLRRTSSRSVTTSCPATRASPEVGLASVQSMLIVVVLPAPFGPRKPNTSPTATSKFTPRTARTSSKFLTRSRTAIAGVGEAPLAWACGIWLRISYDVGISTTSVLASSTSSASSARIRYSGLASLGERLDRALALRLVTDRRHLPGGLADPDHQRTDLGERPKALARRNPTAPARRRGVSRYSRPASVISKWRAPSDSLERTSPSSSSWASVG